MTGFIFSGSKITADGHWRHEIKKTLAPWKKSCDKPRQCIKKQRHYFSDKGLSSQSYGFLVVMYGCDSWIIKKAEHQRIDAFELWCWRRRLRVPWTARRSNQLILKKINLNIRWKDWCWSSNTLATWCEELMLWKIEGKRGRGWQYTFLICSCGWSFAVLMIWLMWALQLGTVSVLPHHCILGALT